MQAVHSGLGALIGAQSSAPPLAAPDLPAWPVLPPLPAPPPLGELELMPLSPPLLLVAPTDALAPLFVSSPAAPAGSTSMASGVQAPNATKSASKEPISRTST